jgi:hypothetical protein
LNSIRRHLSYANVMATIAVFIALGGSAFAVKVKLKANSVSTKNLKASAVTEPKLADGAVTSGKLAANAVNAGKLADGSVTGAKIADGSVGIEKSANSLHQKCPGGTTYQQGGCIENSPRATANWATALSTCSGAGGHVADTGEMEAFFGRGGVITGSGEWTTDLADVNGTTATRVDFNGTPTPQGTATTNPYRCVLQPLG